MRDALTRIEVFAMASRSCYEAFKLKAIAAAEEETSRLLLASSRQTKSE